MFASPEGQLAGTVLMVSVIDGRTANLVTLIVTDNGDGTGHVSVVAYY
jgi:hypothetical protein